MNFSPAQSPKLYRRLQFSHQCPRRMRGHDLLQESRHLLGEGLRGKPSATTLFSSLGELGRIGRILDQLRNFPLQILYVARFKQHASFTVADQLWKGKGTRRNDGAMGEHGLNHRESEGLFGRNMNVDVNQAQNGPGIFASSEKKNAVPGIKLICQTEHGIAICATSEQNKIKLGIFL